MFTLLTAFGFTAGMLILVRATGERMRLPPRALLGPLVLASAINVTLWHVLTGFGLAYMAAGRAGIQRLVADDYTMRCHNVERLRALSIRHRSEATVFSAHDPVEFEALSGA